MNAKKSETKSVPPRTTKLGAVHVVEGGPIQIDLDLIDEDPGQPRSKDNPGFSPASIAELAASYGPRGPKSPISLRHDLDKPGRYIINHGHRRYRAAKHKGLLAIPSFIDDDYNEVDQVIENLQRNELTPREIADWIGRELAKGLKKADIAKSIGKSASYVTQHANLLDLPAPVADVFNAGRVNDVTVINELVTAYKKNPKEVASWLSPPQQELTRGAVKLLREFLEQTRAEGPTSDDEGTNESPATGDGEAKTDTDGGVAGEKPSQAEKLSKPIVLVEHNGRPARLNLRRRPAAVGFAWLKYEDDGQEFESTLAEIKLIALIEGST